MKVAAPGSVAAAEIRRPAGEEVVGTATITSVRKPQTILAIRRMKVGEEVVKVEEAEMA